MHSIVTQGETEKKTRDDRQQGMGEHLNSGLVWYGDHCLWDVVRGGDEVSGTGQGRDALELDTLCKL